MAQDVQLQGFISPSLPAPRISDTTPKLWTPRTGNYNEQYVLSAMPPYKLLAAEGANFVVTNPTPGTKIDYGSAGTQTSFSDTVPFMMFKNNWAAADAKAKQIYLDYIKLIQIGGTAPATTTSVQAVFKIDSKDRTNTAGTLTQLTPVNTNMNDSTASQCQVFVPAGAVATIPAASTSARLVGRAQLKGGPTLLLDEYTICFGKDDNGVGAGYLTTVSSYTTRMPQAQLGPQQWGVLHLWLPGGATNPFSFEFEIGLIER